MKILYKISNSKWTVLSLAVFCICLIIAFSIFATHVTAKTKEAQDEISQVNNELFDVLKELSSTKAQLGQTQNELSTAETYARSVETKLAVANEALKKTSTELEELNTNLAEIEENMFESEQVYGVVITESDVNLIAKTVWGEARGLNDLERSMVVWCILNRVDDGQGSISQVIKAPGQFHGYSPNFPVDKDIVELVRDVLARWQLEKVCEGDVGRTLPSEFLWFSARSGHNIFRDEYEGICNHWTQPEWSQIWNPYA